ncbi:hypothetical protein [Stenotrophomonas maltophilia]|uniref:hypothetical protein n=1 Tax=Stenotrophomonas maltophilia TaxID=40324 RepID=UPI0039F74108
MTEPLWEKLQIFSGALAYVARPHSTAHPTEFPEQQLHSCTGQFNIQGRFHQQTDNSHLSTTPSLSPSRGAADETKIIKGVSR